MLLKEWVESIQQELEEIRLTYPESSVGKKHQMRRRFRQMKEACDQLLSAWVLLEEEMSNVLAEHPEIAQAEPIPQEEFWLHESVVRSFRQGQGYYQLKMYPEAEQMFQDVVEEEPEFLLGRVYLGLSLFQADKWEEAFQHFQLVSQTATQAHFLAFAHHMLGCIYVKLGQDSQAIAQFKKAIEYAPDCADAYFNMAACHYRLGDYHQAIPLFYEALLYNEDDWEAMVYLANCYRHFREWNTVSYWKLAAFEKSKHPEVILSIAQDYEQMGQWEQAMIWYQRLLKNPAYRTAGYQGISWNLLKLNRLPEASLWVKKGLTLAPKDPELLFTYIWIQLSEGNVKQAEKALEVLPEETKQDPAWIMLRSRFFTQTEQYAKANELISKLIDQEKPMIQALGYYQKGRILLEKGEIPQALEYFQTSRQRFPEWKDPLFYEGVCHLLHGRLNETKQCWQQLS